jgi:hypothetical protein
MLNTIYLSTQEVELRIWLRRGRDTSWAALTHSESGVLGSRFVQAFLPDLSGEIGTYRGIAEKVYRECSEFVHGNINTHQKMPDQLKFDEPMFLEWHEKAKNCWMVISVALVTRYLSGLSKDAAKKIEHGTYDAIGHIEEIRAALESKQGE